MCNNESREWRIGSTPESRATGCQAAWESVGVPRFAAEAVFHWERATTAASRESHASAQFVSEEVTRTSARLGTAASIREVVASPRSKSAHEQGSSAHRAVHCGRGRCRQGHGCRSIVEDAGSEAPFTVPCGTGNGLRGGFRSRFSRRDMGGAGFLHG